MLTQVTESYSESNANRAADQIPSSRVIAFNLAIARVQTLIPSSRHNIQVNSATQSYANSASQSYANSARIMLTQVTESNSESIANETLELADQNPASGLLLS